MSLLRKKILWDPPRLTHVEQTLAHPIFSQIPRLRMRRTRTYSSMPEFLYHMVHPTFPTRGDQASIWAPGTSTDSRQVIQYRFRSTTTCFHSTRMHSCETTGYLHRDCELLEA